MRIAASNRKSSSSDLDDEEDQSEKCEEQRYSMSAEPLQDRHCRLSPREKNIHRNYGGRDRIEQVKTDGKILFFCKGRAG